MPLLRGRSVGVVSAAPAGAGVAMRAAGDFAGGPGADVVGGTAAVRG